VVTGDDWAVQRLLQNPMAPRRHPALGGDIVRVSDGRHTVYLPPAEFEKITDDELRYLLARGTN
jgi:plasmid stabilization system protein ParE